MIKLHKNPKKSYTVKRFCEFMNKLIETFQWTMVIMILFSFIDLQLIVLYWSGKLITNNNKYNQYSYNLAATQFQFILHDYFYSVFNKKWIKKRINCSFTWIKLEELTS